MQPSKQLARSDGDDEVSVQPHGCLEVERYPILANVMRLGLLAQREAIGVSPLDEEI